MTKLAFGELAAKLLAPKPVARPVAPNLDSSMRFAVDDLTDHLQRIAEARAHDVAQAVAVVTARKAIDTAYRKLGEDVDPGWYTIEDDAWALVEDAPEDVVRHREEALAAAEEDAPDEEDPHARVAIHAAHDLALELHGLVERLREVEPDLTAEDLRWLVDEAETVDAAEQAEARTLARFEIATDLRRRVEAYAEALRDYLAGWPEGEQEDEEERVRELVFGE